MSSQVKTNPAAISFQQLSQWDVMQLYSLREGCNIHTGKFLNYTSVLSIKSPNHNHGLIVRANF